MKYRSGTKRAYLAITLIFIAPSQPTHAWPSLSTYKDKIQTYWNDNPGIHTPTFIAGGLLTAAAAIRLIWWLAQDRRSDEQVISDTQRLCQTTTQKYNRMVATLEQAQLHSHKTINEHLLVQFIESGVDTYYLQALDNTLSKLNKEHDTLSARITHAKPDALIQRMKVMQQDICVLIARLNPLSNFIHYHIGYINLYMTAATLQETYGPARIVQHSQPELINFVRTRASAFSSYPYIDFVEKIEKGISTLKSRIHAASYAQNTDLAQDAQRLLNDLMIIKGTVASTCEYSHDIHNRELARLQQEKEEAERARIQAKKDRLQMAALAVQAQAEAERMRMQAEQNRIALERQKLEQDKKAQQLKEQPLQKEQERATQAALQREQARLEREYAAAQQAHYEAWQRAQQAAAAYQPQMPAPSAPPLEQETAQTHNYQMPEPSAPLLEEEEDLDALFTTLDKELQFETQETEQFQKDHDF